MHNAKYPNDSIGQQSARAIDNQTIAYVTSPDGTVIRAVTSASNYLPAPFRRDGPGALDRLFRIIDRRLIPRAPLSGGRWHHGFERAVLLNKPVYIAVAGSDQPTFIGIVPHQERQEISVYSERQQICSDAAVQLYAECLGLSQRETEIVSGLCAGLVPKQIAAHNQTSVSTVRTQIKGLLLKAGHDSIRGLMDQLSRLPAIDPVDRSIDCNCQLRSAA